MTVRTLPELSQNVISRSDSDGLILDYLSQQAQDGYWRVSWFLPPAAQTKQYVDPSRNSESRPDKGYNRVQ